MKMYTTEAIIEKPAVGGNSIIQNDPQTTSSSETPPNSSGQVDPNVVNQTIETWKKQPDGYNLTIRALKDLNLIKPEDIPPSADGKVIDTNTVDQNAAKAWMANLSADKNLLNANLAAFKATQEEAKKRGWTPMVTPQTASVTPITQPRV